MIRETPRRHNSSAPGLSPVIICSIAGAICYVLGERSIEAGDKWLAGGISFLFYVFVGIAAFYLFDWLAYKLVIRLRDFTYAWINGEYELNESRRRVLIELKSMDTEHIAAMGRYRATLGVIPGDNHGPAHIVHFPSINDDVNGDVIWEFVTQFIELGKYPYLTPVGSWNEGTDARRNAQIMTAYFTANGYADEASGPKPAKWKNEYLYKVALVSIGYLSESELKENKQ
jgi:hypothetical protein